MTGFSRFVLRRLLLTIPVLVAMSIFVFAIIRLVPGDPVRSMLGFRATDQNVAQIRGQLGLDEPLVTQYWAWITGALHGDLGQDFISKVPISELLSQRFPVTLELTVLSLGLALLVGVPLGVAAATGSGWIRRLTDGFVVLGVSIPDFWLGIMLVLLFSGVLVVLPPRATSPSRSLQQTTSATSLLPVLTLAVGRRPTSLRTTRGAMESALARPFIGFLKAKGVSRRRVVWRHALRNAAAPIITVAAIQFGVLLGGAIVIETLFALPGVGRMLVTAINQRNYPVSPSGTSPSQPCSSRSRSWLTFCSAGSTHASRTGSGAIEPRPVPANRSGATGLAPRSRRWLHWPHLARAHCDLRTHHRPPRSGVGQRLDDHVPTIPRTLVRHRQPWPRCLRPLRVRPACQPHRRGRLRTAFGCPRRSTRRSGGLLRGMDRHRNLSATRHASRTSTSTARSQPHRHPRPRHSHRRRRHRFDLPADPHQGHARERVGSSRASVRRRSAIPRSSHRRILSGHVVPNAIGPVLVQLSILAGFALQIEAALSFLGLGTQPPPHPLWV